MDIAEHITIAKEMIGKLPVLDDNARASLADALSNDPLTRSAVTQIRVGVRGLTMMTPEGEKEKSASDKVLLGLLMKLPEEEKTVFAPTLHTEEPSVYKTTPRKKRLKASTLLPSSGDSDNDIFRLLIEVARTDKDAKRLSVAFWEKLAAVIGKTAHAID